MSVPTPALHLHLSPIADTSKRTPYLCSAEAALPSILDPESQVRELTVVLSHPNILVPLWRENTGVSVGFPSLWLFLKQPLLAVRIKPAHSVVPSPLCKQEEALCFKDSQQECPS